MVSFFAPFPFVVFTSYFLLLILQFCIDSLEFLWVIIELLTFVIIGLVFITACSSVTMFGATIYFITQSILSIIFLALVFFIRFYIVDSSFVLFTLFFVIYVNIGGFPFHSWYYSSVYPFPKVTFLLVLTLHKTPLLVSFTLVFTSFNLLVNDLQQFIMLVIILNLLALGVFSLISSDLRSLVLSTSLANNSWLLISCFSSSLIIIIYIVFYFLLITIVLSSNSSISCWSLVSLSGLPPFPIFFLKLVILIVIISNLSFISSLVFCSLLILFTLLVSFSYLRFTFSTILAKSLLSSIL